MADNSVEAQLERQLDRVIGEKEALRKELQLLREDFENVKHQAQRRESKVRQYLEGCALLEPGDWDRVLGEATRETVALPSEDDWVDLGHWLASGGIRVRAVLGCPATPFQSATAPALALRFQEARFFTQVVLPLERLRSLCDQMGYVLRESDRG